MAINYISLPDFGSLGSIFENCDRPSFSVIHINIRSIRKYWDQFLVDVADVLALVDAFVLSEINVQDDMLSQFRLPNYHEHFFTRTARRGVVE